MTQDVTTQRACTVLVVEDEFLVRELAVCELEESGFHVIDFPTADAALVHLESHVGETAVVFTDVQMPGRLNGLDLADIVSRSWPSIGVLVTSGGPLVNPTKLPSCARFVAKPWRAADIVSRVQVIATRCAGHPAAL
ncbi:MULTISPECIES: response regulator [Lichenihabitans]|uniref:response regulator n=1 Tax=Lichenihabitans TaxID=2723776 RepID=UPI0010367473|nr:MULTISPECIES: response regulator [Lichenihabitans]UDL94091.1 response regulator [Lichenihabitans sp. PAMC28606]